MSLNTQLSDAAANAASNALCPLANGGTLVIYAGTQPANGNATVSGTPLVTFNLSATAFAAASGGSASLNGLPMTATATGTGTASFFVIYRSSANGGGVVLMGSVGTSGCNINLVSTAIVPNIQVQITSYSFSIAESNPGQ